MRLRVLLAGGSVILVAILWSLSQPLGSTAYQSRSRADAERAADLPELRLWSSVVAIPDGYLALGVDQGAMVVARLDAQGKLVSLRAPDSARCDDEVAVVPIAGGDIVAACFHETTFFTWQVRTDARGLVDVQPLGSSAGERRLGMRASSAGPAHVWLLSNTEQRWQLGVGHGAAPPALAAPTEVAPAADVLALSPAQAVVAGTAASGQVLLSELDASGRVVKQVVVGRGEPASARLLRDRQGIVVAWVERRQLAGRNLLALTHSHLKYREYDSGLHPLGDAHRLSEDDFVVSPRAFRFGEAGLLAWDQGAGGTWQAASFASFGAGESAGPQRLLRTPNGELPIAVAAQAEQFAFLSSPTAADGVPKKQRVDFIRRGSVGPPRP